MVDVGDGERSQQKQSKHQCIHVLRGEDKEDSIMRSVMVTDHSLDRHAGGQGQVFKLWHWVKERGTFLDWSREKRVSRVNDRGRLLWLRTDSRPTSVTYNDHALLDAPHPGRLLLTSSVSFFGEQTKLLSSP